MLHYDYYYTIGKNHLVCQDFALRGEMPFPFLVISDGCSSSNNSEIGARILTLSTQHILKNARVWPLEYRVFGQQLIDKAWHVAKKMHLPTSVLDATVMLAFLYQDNIIIYVYGDGCLLFKDHEDQLGTIEMAFTHNAPYYLTYWQDRERWEEYAKFNATPLVLIDSVQGKSELKSFETELVFCFPLKKFKLVAITSDGASQCIDTQKNRKLSLEEVAIHLLNFPNFSHEFIKHHTEAALKEYAQQGIFPADDLSIGVFVQQVTN